jgi:hypothetical protein
MYFHSNAIHAVSNILQWFQLPDTYDSWEKEHLVDAPECVARFWDIFSHTFGLKREDLVLEKFYKITGPYLGEYIEFYC